MNEIGDQNNEDNSGQKIEETMENETDETASDIDEMRDDLNEGTETKERVQDVDAGNSIQKSEEKEEQTEEIKNPEEPGKPDKKPEKNEKTDDGKEDKPKAKKSGKKTLAIIGIILVALAIAIIIYALVYNPARANKFTYKQLQFEKIQFGGIYVYETNLTLIKSGFPTLLNVRLRNDPRQLGKIPVNYSSLKEKVYFTFPQETLNCSSDSLIAAFQVGQYLGNMGFSVTPAVTSNFSGNTLPVVDCSNSSKTKTVIYLKPFGNETRIYQESNGCIVLEARNCDVVQVSESFILSILEKVKVGSQTTPSSSSSNSS